LTPETLTLAALRLARTPGLGARGFARLVARYGDASAALEALPGHARAKHLPVPDITPESVALAEIEAIDAAGARLIAFGTPDYPVGLSLIPDPPPCLIVRGDIRLFDRPACALVGSRNASAAGLRLARDLARGLGAEEVVVVSGLARGIDGAAHQGALETGTIAVVAGGIDHLYPPEHAELQAEIGERGLFLSERPLGAVPTARCFPRRNRIISGLSLGSVIVEAALRSGSLITARCAAEQNREVMAVPGSPLDPRSNGTNRLIRDGAHLIESAEDVLSIIGSARALATREPVPEYDWPQREWPEALPDERNAGDSTGRGQPDLLDLISATPVSVDEIVRQSGLPTGTVRARLLELELDGRVLTTPGERVQRNWSSDS